MPEPQTQGPTPTDPTGPASPPAYTPPATQADLDRIITDRVKRAEARFGDYDDLKAKAQRLDDIEEASKTEAEKAAETLAATQQELESYKTRDQVAGWAKEITQGTPVPPDLLRGSTREELQGHFDQVKAALEAAAPPAPPHKATARDYPDSKTLTGNAALFAQAVERAL